MAKLPRTLVGTAVVLGAVLAGTTAGAQPASQPVGPNQAFVGVVNGEVGSATIDVVCPGPPRVGQQGNPEAGQTVGIATPSAVATTSGFTGSKAHSIVASLVSSTSAATPQEVTFTTYGNEPLPTTWTLPCTGQSTMVFAPRPTSKTARSSRVGVTFEPVCTTPVCPVVTDARRS